MLLLGLDYMYDSLIFQFHVEIISFRIDFRFFLIYFPSIFFVETRFEVLGSDVVYSEGAVADLLTTLNQLSGPETTVFLAGELRNGNTLRSRRR